MYAHEVSKGSNVRIFSPSLVWVSLRKASDMLAARYGLFVWVIFDNRLFGGSN
jgi:hypothetical protein